MLLTQLTGRPIFDVDGERLGAVRDVVVRMDDDDDHPAVVGLVARRERAEVLAPIEAIALDESGAHLTIDADLNEYVRRDGEVLLVKEVLDKSVISLAEKRVVRVNDLAIEAEGGVWRLVGANVDTRGLLRRLLPANLLGSWSESELLDWADTQYLSANAPEADLDLSHERLAELHPVEIAKLVDALSYREGAEILEALDDETAADTLEELPPERQVDIVEALDEERAADILEEMAPDDAADLLADLPEAKAEDLLERMDESESHEVRVLMGYPEDSAGGIMTTDFLTTTLAATAASTLAALRAAESKPDVLYYVYVTPALEDTTLVGVVSLRDLVLSEPGTPIAELMADECIVVSPDLSARDAARRLAEYNLMAAPVVDDDQRLLGVITVDDAMELLLPDFWQRRRPRLFG